MTTLSAWLAHPAAPKTAQVDRIAIQTTPLGFRIWLLPHCG